MARFKVVYIKDDPTNKYAHSDSAALDLVTSAMRVIGFTNVTIYTSTRNVIEIIAKLKLDQDIACKSVEISIQKESNLLSAVRRKLDAGTYSRR